MFEIPFNSSNKWHLSIHKKSHENGVYTLYIKGAPERVFRLCSSLAANGKVETMTEEHQQAFQKSYELMASKGHRVIGCARLQLSSQEYPEGYVFKKDDDEETAEPVANGMSGIYPRGSYTFMGLVSLEDPPKHGVREAIGRCRQAGIKVMMVTGDHPLTAEAIGRKINLMLQETREMVAKRTGRPVASIQEHEYNSIVIHGDQIDKLTEEDWGRILDKEEIIFARTSPKHKLQIVKRCQERGHIVGVTGDGVNDSPALKKADLGIAMNISGSDVSKEAAGMILLDDNFASTVSGITEGRLIFQNLKKSIRYTITHTMPQVIANLCFVIVPVPLPLSPVQIILVDLGFELAIALTYAWEVPESKEQGLMMKLPRKPVTHRSIELLKRENAAKRVQEETINRWVFGESRIEAPVEDESELSFFTRAKLAISRARYWISSLFDMEAWKLYNEPREEEVLVDANILSWAYLEAGIIEAAGCLLAYFHVYWGEKDYKPADVRKFAVESKGKEFENKDMKDVAMMAQSAYYLGICFQQIFNHFICKVTTRLPFGVMLFRNVKSFYGIAFGLAFAFFVVYPPFMSVPFNTFAVPPQYWLFPLAMGFVLLGYSSLRVLYLRRKQPVNLNLALPLDLHPTRWSTKSAN